jgi:hypothetical protein
MVGGDVVLLGLGLAMAAAMARARAPRELPREIPHPAEVRGFRDDAFFSL